MIPKIIHLIWLGGNRPKKFDFLIDEIKRINDDYNVIEWNESNIDFKLINQEIFDTTENLGAKSDILRFELLYKYGGIYMDYDFLQVKKFDNLLEHDFFVGTGDSQPKEIWNSIVGSFKNNEVCYNFLENIKNIKTPIRKHEIGRVMDETGPYLLTRVINNNNFNSNIKILIGDYFFPFPAEERHSIRNLTEENLNYIKSFIKENTYCVHLHTTTWQ